MTAYYASPGGGGNGLSQGSPFLIRQAWNRIMAGDTLFLLDGVYRGSDSMIQPPAGLAGTIDARITIKAMNDGKVLIDGEGNQSRPVYLTWSGNDYFTIEGINVCNGLNGVVTVQGVGNIVRRTIAWNPIQSDEGEQTWRSSGYNALVEDCVAFGGRYAMGCNQMGNDAPADPMTTFRRCLVCYTEATDPSPKASIVYWYNSDPCRWENCIAIWHAANAPNSQGMFYCATADPYVHGAQQTEVIGCLAILKSTQPAPAWISGISAQGNRRITFDNCISAMSPEHPEILLPFDLRAASTTQTGAKDLYLKNSTGIGANPSNIHPDWIQTNVHHGTSIAAVYGSESLWVNDGTKGATICKRYQDGVLTDKGLFPWPMNQRIMDILVATGRPAIDVTAELEAIFGPIPDICRWSNETNGGEEMATLTATPESAIPGGTVTVTWEGSTSASDWIALFSANAADNDPYLDWKYVNCEQAETNPMPSGSCSFIMPASPDIYDFRMFSNNTLSRMAVSNTVIVAEENPEPEPEPEPEPTDWVKVFIPAWVAADDVVRVTQVEVPAKKKKKK